MIVYRDIISNDILLRDKFEPKVVKDIIYEIDTAIIEVRRGNAADGAFEKVLELVYEMKLRQLDIDKKSYQILLRRYVKALRDKLSMAGDDHAIQELQSKRQAYEDYLNKIISDFAQYKVFLGPSHNINGMLVLLGYRKDQKTPYLIFWKDGLAKEEI